MGGTEAMPAAVESAAPACDGGGCCGAPGSCRESDLRQRVADMLSLPWRWNAARHTIETRDGDTVLVRIRETGGALDIDGPERADVGQGIADALNQVYAPRPRVQ